MLLWNERHTFTGDLAHVSPEKGPPRPLLPGRPKGL